MHQIIYFTSGFLLFLYYFHLIRQAVEKEFAVSFGYHPAVEYHDHSAVTAAADETPCPLTEFQHGFRK